MVTFTLAASSDVDACFLVSSVTSAGPDIKTQSIGTDPIAATPTYPSQHRLPACFAQILQGMMDLHKEGSYTTAFLGIPSPKNCTIVIYRNADNQLLGTVTIPTNPTGARLAQEWLARTAAEMAAESQDPGISP